MPFIWDWIWEKLSGIVKTPTQSEGLDQAAVDNKVRKKVVRDGRAVSAKKSDSSAKPARIRSNNQSKTGRKSTGAAIRAAAAKGKAKSKALSKG